MPVLAFYKSMRNLYFPLLLLTISACATNPATEEKGQTKPVAEKPECPRSEEDEIELGKESHRQILQKYAVYNDPELQEYVRGIGEKLAANSRRSDLQYHFTVLDSKEVNAFALPGGYIYITRGLMAYLKSEAELAAVLGHEIGHVTARHAVRQCKASELASIGATLGAVLLPGMDQTINQLVQTLSLAALRGYGREHELEADRLGAEYLANSDYSPQAMLDVIRVLKNQETFEKQLAKQQGREPRVYHGLFSTHPDNDTRLHEVIADAEQASTRKSANYIGHEPYMQKVHNMAYGDSAREGILRGHRFFHHDLHFSVDFPRDWGIDNLPNRIAATAPGGKGLIQMAFIANIDARLPPKQVMLRDLGVSTLRNDSPLSIHGLDAHTGTATMNTSLGLRRSRLAVIYLDNNAYIFTGTTKNAREFSQYDPAFLKTINSFHQLTEEERSSARPLLLETVRSDSSTTFPDLANTSPLENFAEEKLRLLNSKYPKGALKGGELLKIVQ